MLDKARTAHTTSTLHLFDQHIFCPTVQHAGIKALKVDSNEK
jgi:hypothetical protein